jgi:hypothetical protein
LIHRLTRAHAVQRGVRRPGLSLGEADARHKHPNANDQWDFSAPHIASIISVIKSNAMSPFTGVDQSLHSRMPYSRDRFHPCYESGMPAGSSA